MVGNYRTPDIYFEKVFTEKFRSLEKVRIDTPAFLGFTIRGPVGKAVRITSWRSFEDAFGGASNDSFLPAAVYGFFTNGGEACYVIRVAHTEGEDAAITAKTMLRDLYGRPTLRVSALDPGSWGNKIKVKVTQASKPPRTGIRAELEKGLTEAIVDVSSGFEAGAVVKITDNEKTEYVVLTKVDKKRLVWRDTQKLRNEYEPGKTTIEGVEVQLQITSKDQFEIHDNLVLSAAHSRNLVQTVNAASRLVQIEDLKSPTPLPFSLPQPEVEVMLTGGKDGAAVATPADFIGFDRGPGNRSGLCALEDVDEVGLICAPDLMLALEQKGGFKGEGDVEAVQRALVDYCERKKTCFAILDTPRGLDIDQVRDWRRHFDSKYGALYYPWLKVLDPLGSRASGKPYRLIPPSGHIAGLYSRVDQQQGVHKAPANEVMNDVVGLERDLIKDVTDILSPEGINCVRALRGRGIRPWGARTVSSDRLWEHVNVRRLFIMIERSIADGTEWAVFENNDWSLWKAVERLISVFLTGLWKEGMLLGAVPEEAYWVKCDDTNNPEETRDAGEFYCDIGVAAVRPAEFIIFRIGQRTKDIITEEPVS